MGVYESFGKLFRLLGKRVCLGVSGFGCMGVYVCEYVWVCVSGCGCLCVWRRCVCVWVGKHYR